MHISRLKNLRSRSGFTLIELLIVVVIIMILTALIFTIMAQTRKYQRKLKANQRVNNIVEAAKQYQQLLGDYPPDSGDYGNDDEVPGEPDYVISRYLGSKLKDVKSGKVYDPFLRMQETEMGGDEKEVDGMSVKQFLDPWGHPYRIDCQHSKTDEETHSKVTVYGQPYNMESGGKAESMTLEVKAWSMGPDGKESTKPSWVEGSTTDSIDKDDSDNVMSWTGSKS